MEHLDSLLEGKELSSKPELFDMGDKADVQKVIALFEEGNIKQVVDAYEEEERELFGVENPTLVFTPDFEEKFQTYKEELEKKAPEKERGRWVYFPWMFTLVHILEEESFQKVRAARNRNLITEDEQEKFYGATIGIAGLSVGNSIVLAIVLSGGGGRLKLADHDRLALSNTNRIRAGVDSLGLLKTDMTARQVYLLNPYAKIDLYPDGLQDETIADFFDGLDIVIDEVDNLAIKYRIREYARKHKIPVIMGADNGDNAVIDIERYDQNPDMPFFHGRMGEVSYEMLKSLDKPGIGRMIAKHVGPENTALRMLLSLPEMGKTIVSWPQLGNAALLNGIALSYAARRILNGQPLEDSRALVSVDEHLNPELKTKEYKEKHSAIVTEFKKHAGLE